MNAGTPTQVQYPSRTVIRTVLQVLLGLSVLIPEIISELGLNTGLPLIAGVLVICGGIARVMAMPAVNAFLSQWLPWLAPVPPPARD